MQRRRWIGSFGAAAAVWLLSGHSPYRQWDVYRKARLVVAASASDPPAVQLARALSALFGEQLPESRAGFARSRDTNDLVRLVASKQLEVAVLHEGDAYAAFAGAEPFADNGRIALRSLAALGDHLLVCTEAVPNPAAYMLVEALSRRWQTLDPALVRSAGGPRPARAPRVPLHPGASEYYRDHG